MKIKTFPFQLLTYCLEKKYNTYFLSWLFSKILWSFTPFSKKNFVPYMADNWLANYLLYHD